MLITTSILKINIYELRNESVIWNSQPDYLNLSDQSDLIIHYQCDVYNIIAFL